MNESKKLTIQMAIFFLIIFVIFGTIIIKEKQNILFRPKIEQSITNYIHDHYNDLNLNTEKIQESNNIFSVKITNKNNNNHYFFVTYSNKKITDTYKKDYLEGKTILDHISKSLEKELYEKTKTNYKITFDNTLNNYSNKVQQKILTENIKHLKIYTIEKELTTLWDKKTIEQQIINIIKTIETNDFTPKNYTITITNKDDITEEVKIKNIKSELINNDLSIIINDIIDNNKTSILKKHNITYEYLN